MAIIRLSDVKRDIMIPKYWRRIYYQAVDGPTTLVATASPGTIISSSYTVTPTDNCYIKIFAKAVMHTNDEGWRCGFLGIFEGAGGITRRDYGTGSCHHNADNPHLSSTACCTYDGYYASGASYVFEIRGWSTPAASDILAYQMHWWIEVCRA
jgi:hypothetical protein